MRCAPKTYCLERRSDAEPGLHKLHQEAAQKRQQRKHRRSQSQYKAHGLTILGWSAAKVEQRPDSQ